MPRAQRADSADCIFCRIIRGEADAHVVLDDELALGFLDHRPLLRGHVLLVPREHHETLPDLPVRLVGPLFERARRLAAAVERGLGAEGSFVALNNRVSQSVPHVHVHVVPRRRGDGLRGFFWPRSRYAGDADQKAVAAAIRDALGAGEAASGAEER